MSFLSRHVYKLIFITIILSVCLAAWVALAGLVVMSQTNFPDRVSRWWEGVSVTRGQDAPFTRTPTQQLPPSVSSAGVEGEATENRPTEIPPTMTVAHVADQSPDGMAATPTPGQIILLTSASDAAIPPELGATPGVAMAIKPTTTPTVTRSPTPTRTTFNLILLGSDRNIPGKGTWRTDVMALTVMDKETREMGVLAIPRDLYVSIPGHPPERLNTVDFLGHYTKYPGDGQALLDRTLRQNFGFGFDRFIRVDFTGFVDLIDILGGIEVDVDCPFEERFADPELPGGRLLKLEPGLQHLDGYTTLMYVRSRLSTSDLDRSRRQFKVLMALREKILQLNTLLLIPQLWNNYRVTVQTDLSLGEALDLARLAYEFDANDIHGRVIDPSMTIPARTAMKSWILLPEHNKIKKAYDELFSAPSLTEAGRHRGRCP